jgi:magnesium transporter
MSASHTDLDRLHALLHADDAGHLLELVRSLVPGDIARLVTRLDRHEQSQLLTQLPVEDAAQVLAELTPAQAAPLLTTLAADRAAALVERFPSNDQADLLAELGDDARPIIAALSVETASRVQRLSQHAPDTAGGLMVAEFLSFPADATVGDVIDNLRSHAAEYSRLHAQYAYITDADQRLIGVLRLRDLLLLEHHESVRQAMTAEPQRVRAETSLDQLLRFFDRHPFFAVPVVDAADQLLGVVLRVDVEEATAERADRRMLLMTGVLDGEESRTMPWMSRVARRAPWLLVSLLLSLGAASVIGWYEETVAGAIALAVFLPVVSGMGGNSGNQALAVSIRELSLGLIQPHEFRWVILKESSVGFVNGALLGLSVAALCYAWQSNLRLSAVVGAAIAMNTLFAACLGGIVPLMLKQCRLDPALASGPVLSAITDLCGFLFALVLADLILPRAVT